MKTFEKTLYAIIDKKGNVKHSSLSTTKAVALESFLERTLGMWPKCTDTLVKK